MGKNHAVCIPFPAQGHIRPMLKLAQILHSKFDFHITFINTYLSQSQYSSLFQFHINSDPHTFKFEVIHVGPHDPTCMISVIHTILNNRLELPLKELLSKLICSSNGSSSSSSSSNNNNNNNGEDWSPLDNTNIPRRPVTCMISDIAMTSFTLGVAQEVGIPALVLETASACSLLAYLNYSALVDKAIIPLKDASCVTNGYLETEIDWIASMKGLRLKDMPTFFRTTDPNDMMLNAIMSNAYRALNSQAILINTFHALDNDIFNDLSTNFSPNIYPIGPLHLLADPAPDPANTECIQWLDSQEPNSILYVSFGTLTVLTQDQVAEFAFGLANSGKRFLWVVRCDLVVKGEPNSLPLGFEEEIKGRALLVSWCDQERVLAHPSVAGFLTHCGWNSMIESISNGVPMICWPFFTEQVTNSWYCCNVLGIGVKMDEEVKRDEVERVVRELFERMGGKGMREKAIKWRDLAREATMSPHGSSYVNLEKIVNNVLHHLN